MHTSVMIPQKSDNDDRKLATDYESSYQNKTTKWQYVWEAH